MVAGTAGRDEIEPRVCTAARTRMNVVKREVARTPAAVLAGVIVANEDLLARQLHLRSGALDHVDEADDGGRRKLAGRAAQREIVLLEYLGLAINDQHNRPADIAYVQGFVVLIQNEDIATHSGCHRLSGGDLRTRSLCINMSLAPYRILACRQRISQGFSALVRESRLGNELPKRDATPGSIDWPAHIAF